MISMATIRTDGDLFTHCREFLWPVQTERSAAGQDQWVRDLPASVNRQSDNIEEPVDPPIIPDECWPGCSPGM